MPDVPPTVRVRLLDDGAELVIYQSDYDPTKHELFEPGAAASVAEAAAAAAKAVTAAADAEAALVRERRFVLEGMTRAQLVEVITGAGVKEVRERTSKAELVDGILDVEAFKRQDAAMRAAE